MESAPDHGHSISVRSPARRSAASNSSGWGISVASSVGRAIIRAAERAGVPRAELMRILDLPQERLDARDGRISRASIYQLCDYVVTQLGDPAFGLRWGERAEATTFELVSDLVQHASTLRAGLSALLEFQRLLQDEPSFHVLEQGNQVVIRHVHVPEATPQAKRFVSEVTLIQFYKLVCNFGVKVRPHRVSFAYPAPHYRAEYTRVFRGAERFDQEHTELAFDRALMDALSPHRDDDVHSVLRSVAVRRMLQLTNSIPYAQRTRELLVKHEPYRGNMEKSARALGVSARTLRRRLAEEGTTYEQVVSEAFAIIAKQQLANSQLSLQELSDMLGFSRPSGFHRAFKRWTGMTPREYRVQQRSLKAG